MAARHFEVESVFCKWLGRQARDMDGKLDGLKIIEVSDFPKGAPIHEDGSTEYDPAKPLVLFAVCLTSAKAINWWKSCTRERDSIAAQVRA